jgi:hypothetical protein
MLRQSKGAIKKPGEARLSSPHACPGALFWRGGAIGLSLLPLSPIAFEQHCSLERAMALALLRRNAKINVAKKPQLS